MQLITSHGCHHSMENNPTFWCSLPGNLLVVWLTISSLHMSVILIHTMHTMFNRFCYLWIQGRVFDNPTDCVRVLLLSAEDTESADIQKLKTKGEKTKKSTKIKEVPVGLWGDNPVSSTPLQSLYESVLAT